MPYGGFFDRKRAFYYFISFVLLTFVKNVSKINIRDSITEIFMKKIFGKLVNVVAAVMLAVAVFSFAGCEDIKRAQFEFKVYDASESKYYAASDVTLDVEFYRHLAPKTVDSVLDKINAKYYDGAIFYVDTAYSNQIMVGDLKYEDGKIVQNLINGKNPAEIYGEFEYNGTSGSNLKSEKGSIGVWRSWYASNTNDYKTNNAMDTGRATLYIPTSSISGYDGYFCVVAKFDASSEALSAIKAVFDSVATYTEYVIYYTGTYDADKKDDNYGLTFNAVRADDFDENEIEGLFEAEGDQLVCYNKKTVKIPVVGGEVYAEITSAKVR